MTREEEIRRATLGFVYPRCQLCNIQGICKDIVGYCIELDSQEYGFVAGAKWADEHPKNVWHSSEEEPKKNRYILIEVVNTLTPKNEIGYYVEYTKNWVVNVMKTEGFKCRWAYIKDLLPKGGEK